MLCVGQVNILAFAWFAFYCETHAWNTMHGVCLIGSECGFHIRDFSFGED